MKMFTLKEFIEKQNKKNKVNPFNSLQAGDIEQFAYDGDSDMSKYMRGMYELIQDYDKYQKYAKNGDTAKIESLLNKVYCEKKDCENTNVASTPCCGKILCEKHYNAIYSCDVKKCKSVRMCKKCRIKDGYICDDHGVILCKDHKFKGCPCSKNYEDESDRCTVKRCKEIKYECSPCCWKNMCKKHYDNLVLYGCSVKSCEENEERYCEKCVKKFKWYFCEKCKLVLCDKHHTNKNMCDCSDKERKW